MNRGEQPSLKINIKDDDEDSDQNNKTWWSRCLPDSRYYASSIARLYPLQSTQIMVIDATIVTIMAIMIVMTLMKMTDEVDECDDDDQIHPCNQTNNAEWKILTGKLSARDGEGQV